MLTFLVRAPEVQEHSPEDIYSNAVGLLFPDNLKTSHGEAGSHITYLSRFGDLRLGLVEPADHEERVLFAHYLWNAGIQLAEFISAGSVSKSPDHDGRWNVRDEQILELGAGTGIVGITAALAGAGDIVLSDYPSQRILRNLEANVKGNIPESERGRVSARAHEWGILTDPFSREHAQSFTRILCADCLWIDGEHYGLAQSMIHFLSRKDHARVWLVAGFHTGRPKIVSFFDTVVQAGLEIERIWERDADGVERAWDRDREDTERNRWLVIAVMKHKAHEENSAPSLGKEQQVLASMLMQKSNRHV